MVEGVQQGPVLVGTFFMVAEDYLPPTAAPGTWAWYGRRLTTDPSNSDLSLSSIWISFCKTGQGATLQKPPDISG